METKRPVLWLASGRFAGFAAATLVPLVLARVLAPSAFGAYRQVFLVFTSLYLALQAGMAESLYYFLPRERGRAGPFAANAALALAGVGAVGAAALAIGARPVAALLGNAELGRYLPAMGAFLVCMLVSAVLEVVLVAERRHRTAAVAYFASDLGRAAALLLPVLFFPTVGALLAGAVVFAALRLASTILLLWKTYGEAIRFDRHLFARQLAYAMPFAAAVVVDTLQAHLHFYVVSNRFSATTFALYSVASFQIPIVDHVATSAGNVLMVRIAGASDGPAPHAAFRETSLRLSILFLPLVAWLVVSGADLVRLLFGARWASAGPLFVLSSIGIVFSILPTDAVLRAKAETRFLLRIGLLRVVVVAAVLGLLLPRFGLWGAVGSTLAGLAAGRVLSLARVCRVLGTSIGELLPWRSLVAASCASVAAAAAAFVAAQGAPAGWTFLRVASSGSVFGLTYLGLGSRLGLFTGPTALLRLRTV